MRDRYDQFGKQLLYKAFTQAIAELERLPADAPEHTVAWPALVRFGVEVRADPSKRTIEDEELIMATQDIMERWENEAMRKGARRALVNDVIEVYETRFGAMPPEVRAMIEGTQEEAKLHAWLKVAVTRSAEEIAAEIRASRAS